MPENKRLVEADKHLIKMKYLSPLREDFMNQGVHMDDTNRPRIDGSHQRDYARVMYSSSFRRLQGKMQLLGIKNDQFFRNRLTHSLEVAQIARSIANMLDYTEEEIYVVEAGALAHDIGNPPFGHSGERFLNNRFAAIGGFEGNAQTLRILTNIERKRPDFRGLNLTYRTLLSVVKYFNRFDPKRFEQGEKQKFIYDEDYFLLQEFISEKGLKMRTIDVQIVDIADEIAYAAHDLEDGLRLKAFTIDELMHDYFCSYGESESYKKLVELVRDSRDNAGYMKSHIDSTEYSKLFRQELTSALIHLFLSDIALVEMSDEKRRKTGSTYDKELDFTNYGELAHGLKQLVFQCINHNDAVYSYEKHGNTILEFLADYFTAETMSLPPEYRAGQVMKQYSDLQTADKGKLQQRLICDYLAGMMDAYAISTYEKYNGRGIL